MKNIGLFCDGTWQHIDQKFPTNVALLARCALANATVSGATIPQVVYYDDGVGVSQGMLEKTTRILGGAFGKGLDYKIVRAYAFLALNYDPGDRIFIFGFSRGAYTARCLGGLLRWLGILKRANASRADEAMGLYRTRPAKQDGAEQRAAEQAFEARIAPFRAAYSHPAAAFTAPKAYTPGDPASLTPDGEGVWVQYVGVWDTVGSLGVPNNLAFAPSFNAQYRFYDASLSRFVRSARHAVSIDERRQSFAPTLWDNIAGLNTNAAADALDYSQRPYQQTWFPGGHGSVGGGGDDGGLSLAPMLWIAQGASRAGFAWDQAQIAAYAESANPTAAFVKPGFDLGDFVMQLAGVRDRDGPDLFDEVSLPARLRAKRIDGYAPPPLKRAPPVVEGLQNFAPPPDPQGYYAP